MMTKIYKRYLVGLIGGTGFLVLCYILAFNILIWQGMPLQKMPYEALYAYQMGKAKNSQASIIFAGDSALGNSVNASLVSALSGQSAETYALTGAFGYRGTLDMIRSVKAHNPNLRQVIIMQTLDMMTRPVANTYSAAQPLFKTENFPGIDISIFNITVLKSSVKALLAAYTGRTPAEPKIVNDYMMQGPALDEKEPFKPLEPDDITLRKKDILIEISTYCSENGLECLYAHAPIVVDICESSDAYIEAVNQIITEAALTLAYDKPLCIPRDKLGDSYDHVAPAYKDEFTRATFRRLQTYF